MKLTSRTRKLCCLIAPPLATFAMSSSVWAGAYTITDLGVLSIGPFHGYTSSAFDINNSGEVVGTSTNQPAPAFYPFLYNDGQMTNLGILPGGTASANVARGINDSGQIVGYGEDTHADLHAFIYSQGVMKDLGALSVQDPSNPKWHAAAYGINDSGEVVGWSTTAMGAQDAFLYSNGVMTDLGSLGGSGSSAYGINNTGQVVGGAATASGWSHPFLYDQGAMTDLGTLGGAMGWASGINELSQIVGRSQTASSLYHPFFYDDGTMVDLGTLGGESGWASNINNKGQVVGSAQTGSGIYDAFLYSGGDMLDLNNLIDASSGWILSSAEAINNRGQIVGTGIIDGQARAFLMTPKADVPEPSALWLITLGLAGLLFNRQRQLT